MDTAKRTVVGALAMLACAAGADVTLNGPITLTTPMVIATDSVLQGHGNTLTIGGGGALVVNDNVTLTMVDVDVKDVSGTEVRCLGAGSTVALYRVRFSLDGDYTFAMGSVRVVSDFEIRGPHTFAFTSAGSLEVSAFGRFRVPWGTTFCYDPFNDSRTNMVFEDASAELHLDGGTFDAPADGVALTRGTLVIGNSVVLRNYDGASPNTNAAKAITLGDGSVANDMRLLTLPGARLQADGYLDTRNVGP